MFNVTSRAAIRVALLLASTALVTPCFAQSLQPATPRATIDENGVDLSTGTYNQSILSISVAVLTDLAGLRAAAI